jgi:hypothetical protein
MKSARVRNLAVGLTAIALVTSLTVGPAYADQVSATHMITSPGMAAVASGTVTGVNGAAMPGTTVQLFAWPNDSVLNALKVGTLIPTTLLATATTNSSGKYVLQVAAATLKAAAVSSGYANLEIVSAGGGFWFLPYQTDTLPARPAAPVTVNLNGGKGPICGFGPQGQTLVFTGFFKQRQRPNAPATVGQGYIGPYKTRGDFMKFNYTQSTSHSQTTTLGVGISGYGFDAGYSQSGTTADTATDSMAYPSQTRNTWFTTNFNVGQGRGLCHVDPGDTVSHKKQQGKCPRTTQFDDRTVDVYKCIWMLRSTGWFGGGNWVHPPHAPGAPPRFCAKERKHLTFKTANETAVNWSSGWNLGGSLGVKGVNVKVGFNASAQTGYDSNAQMEFDFAQTGWICGTDHDPSHATQLVMRGTRTR